MSNDTLSRSGNRKNNQKEKKPGPKKKKKYRVNV